jgi:hypothetical protein
MKEFSIYFISLIQIELTMSSTGKLGLRFPKVGAKTQSVRKRGKIIIGSKIGARTQ